MTGLTPARKWVTLENKTGTASLKQHAFVSDDDGKNISLCGRIYAVDGGENKIPFVLMEAEAQSNNQCKTCAQIYWRPR